MEKKNCKIWLAPLHGVTTFRFRQVFFRHFDGVDMAITPFLPTIDTQTYSQRLWRDILPQNNVGNAVIPQLMGNVPEQFVNTIQILSNLGYTSVNWNIGCPMPQIVRKTRGCGLMPHPDIVESVVDAVCSRTTAKFSLKMRLGLKSPEEGMEIIERMNKYPLDFLVIHPRLGIQQYEGIPDLATFETVLSNTKHDVIYSGDIWTKNDFENLQQRFPNIKQWMLGRGILRNPFLAEEIKSDHPIENQRIRFKNFYQDLLSEWHNGGLTDLGILNSLKELWHYFAVYCQLTPEQMTGLMRMDDLKEFENRTLSFLE